MNHELEFFDRIAEKWDCRKTYSTPAKVRYILSRCEINHGDHVLDLGTGRGILIPYIAERVGSIGKICAVDFASNRINANFNDFDDIIPRPDLFDGDFEKETIPGRFDKIMIYCIYPFIKDTKATLRRLIDDNLIPGGSIFIAFPTDESVVNDLNKRHNVNAHILPSPSELSLRLLFEGFNARVIEESKHAYIVAISAT